MEEVGNIGSEAQSSCTYNMSMQIMKHVDTAQTNKEIDSFMQMPSLRNKALSKA